MSLPLLGADRLNAILPDFIRFAWTSDTARQIWSSRFQRIIRAWGDTELVASIFGVRRCALITISEKDLPQVEQLWQSRRLAALKLESLPEEPSLSTNCRFAVGTNRDILRFRELWRTQDAEAIGECLGYPACCRKQFQKRCIKHKLLDPVWAMALENTHVTNSVLQVEVKAVPVFTNILWRSIGVRAVPHLPCRFDCHETVEFSMRFLNAAVHLGYQEEVEWLEQILSWPLEWSALHGIAMIKTPVLKISTRTDATATKLVLHWAGEEYPEEGARGLMFPYRVPKRTMVTGSLAFQRGLTQLRS